MIQILRNAGLQAVTISDINSRGNGVIIAYLYHELDRRLASLTILSRRRWAETYPDVR